MIGGGNWAHPIEALRFRDHRLFNTTLAPALISLRAQRAGIGWLARGAAVVRRKSLATALEKPPGAS